MGFESRSLIRDFMKIGKETRIRDAMKYNVARE
jgi:hypothetical protein